MPALDFLRLTRIFNLQRAFTARITVLIVRPSVRRSVCYRVFFHNN